MNESSSPFPFLRPGFLFHLIAQLVQLRAGSGQIKADQTMAALWGKMRYHLMNMKLHTELDITATYLTYMEKQIRSSNTKITTMMVKSNQPDEKPAQKPNQPDEKPAPKPAAKSKGLKKPAGKAVLKPHTKK